MHVFYRNCACTYLHSGSTACTAVFCVHSVCMSKWVWEYIHTRNMYREWHMWIYVYLPHTAGSKERFTVGYFLAERKHLLDRVSFSKPEGVMSGFGTRDCGQFNLPEFELRKVIVFSSICMCIHIYIFMLTGYKECTLSERCSYPTKKQ